jgi:hypothetical protein
MFAYVGEANVTWSRSGEKQKQALREDGLYFRSIWDRILYEYNYIMARYFRFSSVTSGKCRLSSYYDHKLLSDYSKWMFRDRIYSSKLVPCAVKKISPTNEESSE